MAAGGEASDKPRFSSDKPRFSFLTNLAFHRLVAGGEAMWMLSKKTTTHLICDGLAAGKTNRILNSGHRAKNQVHPHSSGENQFFFHFMAMTVTTQMRLTSNIKAIEPRTRFMLMFYLCLTRVDWSFPLQKLTSIPLPNPWELSSGLAKWARPCALDCVLPGRAECGWQARPLSLSLSLPLPLSLSRNPHLVCFARSEF